MPTFSLIYLLLPYGAWLLGTALCRLAPMRIVPAAIILFCGLLPLGDPVHRVAVQAAAAMILGVLLIIIIGLLKRLPPREPL